jgi:hypothetical protein
MAQPTKRCSKLGLKHMFKTFPEFSKLTLDDKGQYEALTKDLPPAHHISFPVLMSWWNTFDGMSVSLLNDNLVIPYWLPGDEKNSGLALIGTKNIDESLCTLFDHLNDRGDQIRLVNVPEFVLGNIRYPTMFNFKEERIHNEYILPVSGYYPIKNMQAHRRRRVESQFAKARDDDIVTRSLDLGRSGNRDFLWHEMLKWQSKGINDYGKLEQDAMAICINNAEALGIDNVCLFVNGELYGFCLYHVERDRRYVSIDHVKATHVSTLGFELVAYSFAKWFAELGVVYANLGADVGVMRLRMFMLTLGPCNFFRKYKIEPA